MDLELDESRNSLVIIFDPDEAEGACDHIELLFEAERKKGGVLPFFSRKNFIAPALKGERVGVEFGNECFEIGLQFVRHIMCYLEDSDEVERFNMFLLRAELWHAGLGPA